MHKILFFLGLCLLICIACNERGTGTIIDRVEPAGSLDKKAAERSLAGEAMPAAAESGIEEKIIKTAYASIKTSRVEDAYDQALRLVKKYDCIILNADISRHENSEEVQLALKLRPEHFMTLLDELHTLGKVESRSISEEDVTEEYYDIKARLTNARRVQERLYGILKKANRVEDILKVEKEIERVGEKIEVLEGKIRYYESRVDYSRITITMYSRRAASVIDFSGIGRGFRDAIKYSINFFFIIIWFIIIIIPLIIVMLLLRPVVRYFIKKMKRKKK